LTPGCMCGLQELRKIHCCAKLYVMMRCAPCCPDSFFNSWIHTKFAHSTSARMRAVTAVCALCLAAAASAFAPQFQNHIALGARSAAAMPRRSAVIMMAKKKQKEPKTVGKNGKPVFKYIPPKVRLQVWAVYKWSPFMFRARNRFTKLQGRYRTQSRLQDDIGSH